jgi:hypothetical protein
MRVPEEPTIAPLESSTVPQETFLVEDILDREWRWHPYKNGGGAWTSYYLIKWLNYPTTENTWEPVHHLRRKGVEKMRKDLDRKFNQEKLKMKPSGKPPDEDNRD